MKKTIIRLAGFLIVLTLVLMQCDNIMRLKSVGGNLQMADFYKQKHNTIDVCILGSSHSYVNFNNGTLWDEYGIASYNLGASEQPLWNTYYYLKEALKTQKPQLIVLEGFASGYDFEYSGDGVALKSIISMKWSPDRIKAAMASAPKDKWAQFLLGYPTYHGRYKELNGYDFSDDIVVGDIYNYPPGNKGQVFMDGPDGFEMPDVSGVTQPVDLYEKSEKYYRKIIELAQSKSIPIIVVFTPYNISEEEQGKAIRAAQIADEYGVECFNCNTMVDEMVLDTVTGFHDNAHMTIWASEVFSRFIGQHLKDNYEISDRRGDPKYSSWDTNALLTRSWKENAEFKLSTDKNELLERINDPRYQVMISMDGDCQGLDMGSFEILASQGILDAALSRMWLKQNGEVVWASGLYDEDAYIRNGNYDFSMTRRDDGYGYYNTLLVNRNPEKKVAHGLNFVIYDTVTNTIVDSLGMDMYENYNVVR